MDVSATALGQAILTDKEAASRYRLSVYWFQRKRVEGGGPKFIKLGNAVRYRASDLDAYFAAQTVDSTSGVYRGKRGRKPQSKPA